jgi:hypothetical protein
MSRTPEAGAVLYNTEATWAEVSTTYGTRLQTVGPIDVTKLTRQKLIPNNTTQLRNEITPGVNGVFGGEFDVEFKLTGHGSTTAGVITLSALETLLGIVVGNVAASRTAGGSTATAGGTVSSINTAAVNGYNPGSILRCGSIADGRGNGQPAVVSSHGTSIIALLTAIDAALNNGDILYNPAMIYPTENPTASAAVTPTRWRFISANMQYDCRGCYPKSWTKSGLGPSGEPTIKITFGVSVWFETASGTLPDVTSVQTFAHAPVSAGSFFFGAYGSTTRDATTKLNIRDFNITHKIGIVERKGHYGNYAGQVVTGCARTRDEITGDFTIDAPDATAASALLANWSANSPYHMLYGWSAADGSAGGLYSPYVVPDGDPPVQFNMDGINSMRLKFRCGSDKTKSTDLERSAVRYFSG